MFVSTLQLHPHVFPNVIPVYLSCDNINTRGSVLAKEDLLGVIAHELIGRDILDRRQWETVGIKQSEPLQAIITALRKANKRVFLLLDEIDQLYRVSRPKAATMTPNDALLIDSCHRTLNALAEFGNSPLGTVGVFLCGSSTLCPFLIKLCASKLLSREFPMVVSAPSLNARKFRQLSLNTPPCVDLDEVKAVLGDGLSTEVARVAAFLAGSNPRALVNVMPKLECPALPAVSDEKLLLLAAGIMRKFYDCNRDLLDSLTDDGFPCPRLVMQSNWEEKFRPLEWEDVMLDSTFEGGGRAFKRAIALYFLVDAGYISVHGDLIYPGSLMLVYHHMSCDGRAGYGKTVWEKRVRVLNANVNV